MPSQCIGVLLELARSQGPCMRQWRSRMALTAIGRLCKRCGGCVMGSYGIHCQLVLPAFPYQVFLASTQSGGQFIPKRLRMMDPLQALRQGSPCRSASCFAAVLLGEIMPHVRQGLGWRFWRAKLLACLCLIFQLEFHDCKMEVLYHIRLYFVGIFPYIT